MLEEEEEALQENMKKIAPETFLDASYQKVKELEYFLASLHTQISSQDKRMIEIFLDLLSIDDNDRVLEVFKKHKVVINDTEGKELFNWAESTI